MGPDRISLVLGISDIGVPFLWEPKVKVIENSPGPQVDPLPVSEFQGQTEASR